MVFNEDKTRVVHLEEGCDFLGFTIRRYHGKLLIKPNREAVRRIRNRLRAEVRSLHGANAAAVLQRLNPIIRGWSAYYRSMVASEVFTALDDYMWKLTYKWATRAHPNKPRHWVTTRYYGTFNKSRQDQWVFGDRDSGAYLLKYAWTKIVRHQMVHGSAFPDDPALATYWAERRRTSPPPPINRATLRLLQAQNGQFLICRGPLLHADSAVQPHRVGTRAARHPTGGHHQEDHLSRDRNVGRGATPSHPLVLHCTPVSLSGLLEPSCGESPHRRF
ncbi:group II intron maturase-specific domain-containing protein [Streptomyces sp. NPDC050759]|uniref:group II intron maturase-specific domain-containing protein n=1 Tax=Streptomyces sp. NPDC050759 TaxID=3365635 RepID=UPI0037969493